LSRCTPIAERRAVAGDCQDALKYGISTYVDEIDDAVNKAYAGAIEQFLAQPQLSAQEN
jgi:hypothetical protein